MKKSLLALAALTAFAGVASAQSSVTLFGVVDLNLRSTKNGSTSLKTMSQDGIASSRLGFRGVEDLGGGLRAGFWIEGATNPDVGTSGGQSWQRRSTLSLMGGFGELRLGRDYTPSFWNTTVFDPFGTNGVGSTLNVMNTSLGSGATTFVRANNSIGYFLPSAGGVYGQAMVAAGEGTNTNKYMGLRVGFAGGPVNVAFAFGKTEVNSANDFEHMNVGGSFVAGPATIMAQYDTAEFAREEQKRVLIGARINVGAGTIKASYTKASGDTASTTLTNQYDATQIALGYEHNLSKRTALYGTYSRVNNDGTSTNGAAFTVGTPGIAAARGQTSTGVEVGVRHTF